MDLQMQIQDLKDQINNARGNQELMMQLNQEMMVLFQQMSKKQLVPMLIRSLLWFGLLGLLNLLFGQYTEFLPFPFLFGRGLFSLYLFVSLSLSLVMFGYKKLKEKMNPPLEKKEEAVIDHIRALRGTIIQPRPETPSTPSTPSNSSEPYQSWEPAPEPQPSKSWKTKLDDN